MKLVIFLTFITSFTFGQNFLPQKDTIILNNDGSEIRYQVKGHAIYMTTYKDEKWNGPFKAYYRNGKIWSENNRKDNKIEGKSFSYTPNGDTATIDEWRESRMITNIVFYSSTIKEPQEYFFVSKKGFPVLLNGIKTKRDKFTPDSLIEEGPDNGYMWIKGERKLLYGIEDAKFVPITTGDKPGFYKVVGEMKTFFRPFSEGEQKMFMKPSPKTEKKK